MLKLEELPAYRMIIEKGKKEMIIKQLRKKFRDFPVKYEEMIKTADDNVLEKIADDIFDIEKPEDLEKYFDK